MENIGQKVCNIYISMTLTICMLGNFFTIFLSSADFFKVKFSKSPFINITWVSNSLDPDQARHSVGPDLSPNCLQRLSADEKIHR